jgi:hypothetical protein
MKAYQNEKNQFEASLTAYIPNLGQAMLLATVDYTDESCWIKEGFLLVEGRPAKGLCIKTSLDHHQVPLEFRPLVLPPIEKELAWGLDWAMATLITTIFKEDRELSREVSLLWDRPKQSLSERDILMMYLRGIYGDSFSQVHGETQCPALKSFLADILMIPPFKTEKII